MNSSLHQLKQDEAEVDSRNFRNKLETNSRLPRVRHPKSLNDAPCRQSPERSAPVAGVPLVRLRSGPGDVGERRGLHRVHPRDQPAEARANHGEADREEEGL